MAMTLLDMVQDIHNALDFDEVNSIDDTIESQQVAQVIKSAYFAMMASRNWPHLRKTLKLTSFSNNEMPTHLKVPDLVKELVMLNYDSSKKGQTRKTYRELKWLEPDAFLRKINSRNSDNSTVDVIIDPSGVELNIENNKAPDYFTSFDDSTIVFDSYNKEIEDTIVASKTQVVAYVTPEWSHIDTFIPKLPEEAFPALLEEAKSQCAYRYKQAADEKAEQEARRQKAWLSRKAWKVNGGIKYPDYGRRTRK